MCVLPQRKGRPGAHALANTEPRIGLALLAKGPVDSHTPAASAVPAPALGARGPD